MNPDWKVTSDLSWASRAWWGARRRELRIGGGGGGCRRIGGDREVRMGGRLGDVVGSREFARTMVRRKIGDGRW